MRKLFSLLISSNADLPKDSLLLKLRWQETNAVDQTLILRHQKRLRQMLLVQGGEELRATFLLKKPSSFGRKSHDKLDLTSATFLSNVQFTKADILQFVRAIGDHNPLHQQAPFLIPACLYLDYLRQVLPQRASALSLRFLAPAYAQDRLSLCCHQKNFYLCKGDIIIVKGEIV